MKKILLAARRAIVALAAALVLTPAYGQQIPQPWDFQLPPTGIATTIISMPGQFDLAHGWVTSYTTGSNGVCNAASLGLSSEVLYLTKPGVCTVTATNPGNAQYLPLNVTMTMTVTWTVAFTLTQQPIRVGDSAAAGFSYQFDSSSSYYCAVDWDDPAPGTAAIGVNSTSSTNTGNTAFCDASHAYSTAGIYDVVAILSANAGVDYHRGEVFVYDPASALSGSGSFASLPGAFSRDPTLTGTFNFQVSSSYAPGAGYPTGNIAFQLVGGEIPISFQANFQYVLVASGGSARLIGTGLDGNNEQFLFELDWLDGAPDRIRAIVTDSAGNVVYDTQPADPPGAPPNTALTAGNITVTP